MLGRIRWGSGRKGGLRMEQILGLSVLLVELPQNSRRLEKKIKWAAEMLRNNHVTRVLTPPEFPWWTILIRAGLRPVETRTLRTALTPAWVVAQLERRNVFPRDAVLCLKGERVEYDMERVARELCPMVRNLILDIPGGYETANRLRRELGMPILPKGFLNAHLTLQFDGGPVLTGAEVVLPYGELPTDCDKFSLIGVLWETGRIHTEEIALKV